MLQKHNLEAQIFQLQTTINLLDCAGNSFDQFFVVDPDGRLNIGLL